MSVRSDINKSIYFPEPIGCEVQAEELLEKVVDEKYYLSEEDALSFILDISDKQPKHGVNICVKNKGVCCKRILTPSCISKNSKIKMRKDFHICPTLMADKNYAKGNYRHFLTTADFPRPGVLELWHTTEQVMIPYKELIDSASVVAERKFKIVNASKNDILELLDNLDVGDYFRLRRLTPRECFRFMSVEEKAIDKLVTSGVPESQLHKQAGNAIVVQVLVNLYKSIFNDINEWY